MRLLHFSAALATESKTVRHLNLEISRIIQIVSAETSTVMVERFDQGALYAEGCDEVDPLERQPT